MDAVAVHVFCLQCVLYALPTALAYQFFLWCHWLCGMFLDALAWVPPQHRGRRLRWACDPLAALLQAAVVNRLALLSWSASIVADVFVTRPVSPWLLLHTQVWFINVLARPPVSPLWRALAMGCKGHWFVTAVLMPVLREQAATVHTVAIGCACVAAARYAGMYVGRCVEAGGGLDVPYGPNGPYGPDGLQGPQGPEGPQGPYGPEGTG